MRIFFRTMIISTLVLMMVYAMGFRMLALAPPLADMMSAERLDPVDSEGYFWEDLQQEELQDSDGQQRDLSEYVDPEHGKYLDSGFYTGGPYRFALDDPNLSTDQAILQIRYCMVFLVFWVIPFGAACVVVFIFCRWIYRLIVHSV